MKKTDIDETIRKAIEKHSEISAYNEYGNFENYSWRSHQDVETHLDEIWKTFEMLYDYLGIEIKYYPEKPSRIKLIKKRSKKHDKKETRNT